MIKITLEDINRKSPYEVTLNNGDFDFTTDSGTRYSVSFLEDVPLGGCDTYQFGFRKREDTHSGYDAHMGRQESEISPQPSAISFRPLKVSQEKFAKHLEVRLRIRIFAAVVLKRMRALRRNNV
ncbi:hypothetical protein M1D30_04480 [Prevotella sp. E15-22]|uniref:hypothetical protein n=1 Tax=Prevotella sp. E15-22 TaxID=2937774 RepID=UPI002051B56C|nr:hypothetical protein [Prevotella sp. E15-22]UPS45436.1 hypothetical protein M1D30_04480 [Prevotella sp. E15-22]